MANYLWLVWYRAKTYRAPKHWALVVNYEMEEEAFGTVYQVCCHRQISAISYLNTVWSRHKIKGDGSAQYTTEVNRAVELRDQRSRHEPYHGRLLLGEIIDDVIKMMEEYTNTATEIVNSTNQVRGGVGDLNSQDWILIIVRSLEDARLLPRGSLKRARDCPRYDK
jgi:hypothetical protein